MEPKSTGLPLRIIAVVACLILLPIAWKFVVFQLGVGFVPGYAYTAENPPRALTDDPQDIGQALEIGERESARAKSIMVYQRLIEKYPEEPALYANLLRYACVYGPFNGPARPEIAKPDSQPLPAWKPYADSPELRLVEHAIKKGKELDPGNAYFDVFEAILRFGQERDAEALAAIHRAAGGPSFDSHVSEEMYAALRDTRRSMGPVFYWLSPTQHVYVCIAGRFPHLARYREAVRMADWYAGQDAKAGRTREAMTITSDLITFSGTMMDDAQWAVDAIVANSMQRLAVRGAYESLVGSSLQREASLMLPWDPNYRKMDSLRYSEVLSAVRLRAPDALRPAQWRSLGDRISRSEALTKKTTDFFSHHRWNRRMFLLTVCCGMTFVGATYLTMAIAFGLLYLVSHVWLVRRHQADLAAGPSRLSVWLLSIVPCILALIVMQGWGETPLRTWFWSKEGPDTQVFVIVIFALRIIFVALVALIAAAGTTRLERPCRWNGFLARLRTGSAYVAQAMVALYLINLIVAIPPAAYINHQLDLWAKGEMQMVRDYQPPPE